MHITKREKEILKLCIFPEKKIAKTLFIQICTLKTHLTNLFKKFQCKNRSELLIKALKSKAITLEEIDCGFWNENGEYIEDFQLVDFSKE